MALLNEEKFEGFAMRTINITHSAVSWEMIDELCHCCDMAMLSIIIMAIVSRELQHINFLNNG